LKVKNGQDELLELLTDCQKILKKRDLKGFGGNPVSKWGEKKSRTFTRLSTKNIKTPSWEDLPGEFTLCRGRKGRECRQEDIRKKGLRESGCNQRKVGSASVGKESGETDDLEVRTTEGETQMPTRTKFHCYRQARGGSGCPSKSGPCRLKKVDSRTKNAACY